MTTFHFVADQADSCAIHAAVAAVQREGDYLPGDGRQVEYADVLDEVRSGR